MIRLAHVWSADLGLLLSIPHIRHLIDRGWEVYGICPPGPRIDEIEQAGVRWLPHSLERKMLAKGDPKALLDLYRTYRRHRFHIVHTHNAKVGIAARVVAAAARVPIVAHTHNGLIYSLDSPATFKYGVAGLERIASEVAHCVFVQSQDDYDALVTTGGAHPDVLHLLGNGVDMARFDPRRFDASARRNIRTAMGVADQEILFFSAGRLVDEKGFVELFEAHRIARSENPAVRLAIAGPTDTERGLGIAASILERAQ
ncbi:MAG TPA: glycosyltransferase, partial [Polyangiaceae bacterium]|nr:glycosyltransferase [Polyangiaceae bacterium]